MKTESNTRLERFKVAQDSPNGGYASSLAEIEAGRKRGHWIWYIFPQLSGLGSSDLSDRFAIDGRREAAEFLRDPTLRLRLLAITGAVATQLRAREAASMRTLMGSHTDALKIVSSLTLFASVAKDLHIREGLTDCDALARVADEVLAIAASQGYPACEFTLQAIQGTA